MATTELRQRPTAKDVPAPNLAAGITTAIPENVDIEHPSGKEKYSQTIVFLRALSFSIYFFGSAAM